MGVILKRFAAPDEVREFEKGSLEVLNIGGMTVGRARYEPGWKWSVHVAPAAGTKSCEVEHVGVVVSGRAAVKMGDGSQVVLEPGDVFYVPPGHDSWVVGDEPYVSLHLLGASDYAAGHEDD
jgi:mannose-6-phosphate isomerase-like protein (cupin superfamily)